MNKEQISAKLRRLDDLLNKLSDAVESGNPVLDLPPANGLIADCQTGCLDIVSKIAEAGIQFWLDGRSLLAASRTQMLLPWETSAEIGTTEEGWRMLSESGFAEKMDLRIDGRRILPFNRPAYGKLCPEVNVLVWTAKDGAAVLDGERKIAVPEDYFLPLDSCTLNGTEWPRPAKAWSLLEAEFGEGWRTMM